MNRWLRYGLPVGLLVLLAVALVAFSPGDRLDTGAPPPEEIAFERTELAPGHITLHVRNVAGADVTVAQVLVDDAYWAFTMDPGTTLAPYRAGTIHLEYPWVEGEAHAILLLLSTGAVMEHEIEVAIETPAPTLAAWGTYGLIGLLVGVLPIAAGMAFFPILRDASARRTGLVLAFTLGLLAFLLVDTVEDGLEIAGELAGGYHATALFAGAALLAIVVVLALDHALRARRREATTLAILIALSIGLHNLGEGLVIGSAFAVGAVALGTTLIAGFAIHNVTEGPAIVAPLARGGTLPAARFAGLAALGGLPTVAGAWMGGFWSNGVWPVLFFGLGAGAILVVLVQVTRQMRKQGDDPASGANLAAFAVGFLVMLATAFLTA